MSLTTLSRRCRPSTALKGEFVHALSVTFRPRARRAGCSHPPASSGSRSAPRPAVPTTRGSGGSAGGNEKIGVALITKDSSNPFFVAMQKGAKEDAAKQNVDLTVASGKQEGDDQGQITAIEDAIARGDKGILITPMSTGVNAAIKKARDAGLYVIALDTPPDPADTVDITFATDNRLGRPARRQVGGVDPRRQGGHHRPARPVQRQDRLRRLRPGPGLPRGHGHRRGRPEEER